MTGKTLAITMGCPAGIGPEIIVKAHSSGAFPQNATIVVIGDEAVLRRSAAALGVSLSIVPWQPGLTARADVLQLLPVSNLKDEFTWGVPTAATAAAMAAYIKEAVRLHLGGTIDAIITCPISKAALKKAGFDFPGHTEMIAALCGCDEYAMMMAGGKLRITLATIHVALKEVPQRLSRLGLTRLITLTARALRDDFAIDFPRLAVAGLNPHAGEEGLFGDEEQTIIAPAIAAASADWFTIDGPLPPDTVFLKALADRPDEGSAADAKDGAGATDRMEEVSRAPGKAQKRPTGRYDAVVCMYHDQGLIPFKLLHFQDGVNVTVGLPLVRTSVDHGTAYDIAGKGVADPGSLVAAVAMAADIAANRQGKGTRP